MASGGLAHGLVADEVAAGSPRCVVLGGGDQELTGGVEGVRLPSYGEHALPEDEVDVSALADPEADTDKTRSDQHRYTPWSE